MFSTKKKKIVPATMIRQLNFDKTLFYNGIFLCKSQLDKFVNIVKYCHCLLCIIQPPTFQQKFSVGCFSELSQKHVIFVVNLPNNFSLIYKWKDT